VSCGHRLVALGREREAGEMRLRITLACCAALALTVGVAPAGEGTE